MFRYLRAARDHCMQQSRLFSPMGLTLSSRTCPKREQRQQCAALEEKEAKYARSRIDGRTLANTAAKQPSGCKVR